jgi:hypothetical protein
VAISRWPKIPSFAYADNGMLAAPEMSASAWHDALLLSLPETFDRSKRLARGAVPLPQQAPWPRQSPIGQSPVRTAGNAPALPVPAQGIFQIPEKNNAAIKALTPLPHHAEQLPNPAGEGINSIEKMISLDASAARRPIPGSVPVTETGLKPGPVLAR